jgi:hypothetical protein
VSGCAEAGGYIPVLLKDGEGGADVGVAHHEDAGARGQAPLQVLVEGNLLGAKEAGSQVLSVHDRGSSRKCKTSLPGSLHPRKLNETTFIFLSLSMDALIALTYAGQLDGEGGSPLDVAALDVAVAGPRRGGLMDADVHRQRHIHLRHQEKGFERIIQAERPSRKTPGGTGETGHPGKPDSSEHHLQHDGTHLVVRKHGKAVLHGRVGVPHVQVLSDRLVVEEPGRRQRGQRSDTHSSPSHGASRVPKGHHPGKQRERTRGGKGSEAAFTPTAR